MREDGWERGRASDDVAENTRRGGHEIPGHVVVLRLEELGHGRDGEA